MGGDRFTVGAKRGLALLPSDLSVGDRGGFSLTQPVDMFNIAYFFLQYNRGTMFRNMGSKWLPHKGRGSVPEGCSLRNQRGVDTTGGRSGSALIAFVCAMKHKNRFYST